MVLGGASLLLVMIQENPADGYDVQYITCPAIEIFSLS